MSIVIPISGPSRVPAAKGLAASDVNITNATQTPVETGVSVVRCLGESSNVWLAVTRVVDIY